MTIQCPTCRKQIPSKLEWRGGQKLKCSCCGLVIWVCGVWEFISQMIPWSKS